MSNSKMVDFTTKLQDLLAEYDCGLFVEYSYKNPTGVLTLVMDRGQEQDNRFAISGLTYDGYCTPTNEAAK